MEERDDDGKQWFTQENTRNLLVDFVAAGMYIVWRCCFKLHVSYPVKLHVAEVAKNPIKLCHKERVKNEKKKNLKKIPKFVTLAYTFIFL